MWRRALHVVPPFVLSLCAAALLAACATNPVTGKRELTLMSEAQEKQLGLQSDAEVRQEMGLYDDPALQRYVQEIGSRLAAASERPGLDWRFAVVDVAAVNAFALPGGYIYVTRGILPYLGSEAELAGVLGHEIGHVTARHAVQQYTRATLGQLTLAGVGLFSQKARAVGGLASTGLGVLFLKYGREDEVQADSLGVRYASRAGWNPRGVPALLTTLSRLEATSDRRGVPNWLQTHPDPADRVRDVEPVVQRAEARADGAAWTVDREGYLRRMDGIIFGDNPREGLVRGKDFLHPELRFAVAFPSDWAINNGKTQVVAASPDGDALVLLEPVKNAAGRSLRDTAVASMERARFTLLEGSAGTINGLDAFVGTYAGTVQGVGDARVRAAHIALRGQVYLLAGLASASGTPETVNAFNTTIHSFRELSRAEAEAIRPNRVGLYTTKPGDTWEAIARRHGGIVMPAALATMNGSSASEEPRPGEVVKVVVAAR